MENTNRLFDQIKAAATKDEAKEFPSMDKVWSRVEDKLDNRVLAHQNNLWKKLALCASVLLVAFIGYHCFTAEEKTAAPKKNLIATDTIQKIIPQNNRAIVEAPVNEPLKTPEVTQPPTPSQIVINNNYTINPQDGKSVVISDSVVLNNQPSISMHRRSNGSYAPIFSARGVIYQDIETQNEPPAAAKKAKEENKKLDPLIVIDDKTSQKIDVDADEIESMEILTDPLYIINGSYYTEKQLFGPQPTSPYAPLSKLKIETITILQNEKAIAAYGERGKKGVVIITTKSGKPEFK